MGTTSIMLHPWFLLSKPLEPRTIRWTMRDDLEIKGQYLMVRVVAVISVKGFESLPNILCTRMDKATAFLLTASWNIIRDCHRGMLWPRVISLAAEVLRLWTLSMHF